MKIDLYQNFLNAINIYEEQTKKNDTNELFKKYTSNFKQNLSGQFMLIYGKDIKEKLYGEEFFVTRKIDGELRTILFDGEQTVMYTSGNTKQTDFPCLDEITKICKLNNFSNAAFVGELNFVADDNKRTRVTDVIHAVSNKNLHKKLRLSIFDILFIDSKKCAKSNDYKVTHDKILEIFGKEKNFFVEPIQMEIAKTTKEVELIYKKWVEQENAEGLVIRGDTPFMWKIKPQHTIDAVALGFTVGENGIRDILFGVTEKDGKYRIFAHGGNGLTNEQRQIYLEKFNEIKCNTTFYYTDSRNVVFQMIEPKYVFEIGVIDFLTADCFQKTKYNTILDYSKKKGFTFSKRMPGISACSLQILYLRVDKNPIYEDTRIEQISNIVPFIEDDFFAKKIEKLPPSEIVYKSVYRKIQKSKIYVKKYVILKTNKEHTKKFSPYILHITDYSSGRKDFMKKWIFPSSSKEQLLEIMRNKIKKEIKLGWILC